MIFGRIKFGLGIFHFAISLVPSTFVWVIELLGFHADRDHGLKELEIAKNCDCARSVDAELALGLFNWYFLDHIDKAQELLDNLIKKYPKAVMFNMFRAFIERKEGNVTASLKYFDAAVENSKHLDQYHLTVCYERAHAYYLLNDFENAMPAMENFIFKSTSKNFKAYGSYKLGVCYWFLNQHDKIKPIYEKIPEHVKPNFSFDRYGLKKSAKFLAIGKISKFEEVLILIINMHEARNWNACLTECEKLKTFFSNYDGPEDLPAITSQYHYYVGCCYHGLKQNLDSRKNFKKVLELEKSLQTEDKFVIPHALVELSEMFIEEKKFEKAKPLIELAKNFPQPYDFDRILQLRITKCMEKIKKGN